ncbi:alpha/beta hydrolase [Undibacterium sp. TJN25]|uniref:alpha/beta hydrolase n=1 Tax=Undibacterium sp. TJN25 TaxID=3413056 RepID=UPI003BF0A020
MNIINKTLAIFLLALAGTGVSTVANAEPIKNIVLVHGAWADGSGWKGIYDILKRDGYNVSVVANPDTGLADDIAATQRTLDRQNGPVVLVGHSYGGVIISHAGVDPKVKALVYIAAFAPDIGESAAQFLPKGPLPGTPTKDGILFMDRPTYLAAFAPDVPQDVKEFMADSQVPIQLSGVTAKATTAAWKDKPTWYLVSQNDLIIPPDNERMFAKRMKATTEEVAGSHVQFVAHPQEAAKLIEAAAYGAGSK